MINLIQFPWSPFCITARRILERHKIHHCSWDNHGLRGMYGWLHKPDATFWISVIRVICGSISFSPFLWRDPTTSGFKVNDSYVIPSRPLVERVSLVRFKKRKFGRGCVEQWTKQRAQLTVQFTELLRPMDNMLSSSPFLIADRPLFVDDDLYGVLENFLYTSRTKLTTLPHLLRWHKTMQSR